MASVKIFLTLLCCVIVSSNSLYDLFRSPSSFFKIRHRRNNSPPLKLGSSRAQPRILNKDIFSPPGGQKHATSLRKTSWRRSDEYLEEPSTFFPSKPIDFEPDFKHIADKHSEGPEFSLPPKLSNPLQFKSRKYSGKKRILRELKLSDVREFLFQNHLPPTLPQLRKSQSILGTH